MSPDATALETAQADSGAAIVSTLADEVGPRRPTSRSEPIAAEVVGEVLRAAGLDVRREPGLTYDVTAVLTRGGRALTFATGDGGRIPNYHQPTDTVANVDARTLARAVAVGREMVLLIDRGRADWSDTRPAEAHARSRRDRGSG